MFCILSKYLLLLYKSIKLSHVIIYLSFFFSYNFSDYKQTEDKNYFFLSILFARICMCLVKHQREIFILCIQQIYFHIYVYSNFCYYNIIFSYVCIIILQVKDFLKFSILQEKPYDLIFLIFFFFVYPLIIYRFLELNYLIKYILIF